MKKEKGISLIVLVLIIILIVAIGAISVFFIMNNKDVVNTNNTYYNSNSGNSKNNVDLTIDESVSKTLNCSVTEEYIKGNVYSTEIVLPNWNRYTFLKEYGTNRVDFDQTFDNDDTSQKTRLFSDDLIIHIRYKIDTYSVNMYANQKERMTDSLLYRDVGKPTVYGNENGYWYAYMAKDDISYREKDTNFLYINIYKDLDMVGQYNMKYMLEIELDVVYMNETGKIRLNYILNDLKEILTEKYNLDLSQLSVDMIKK